MAILFEAARAVCLLELDKRSMRLRYQKASPMKPLLQSTALNAKHFLLLRSSRESSQFIGSKTNKMLSLGNKCFEYQEA